MDQELEEKFAAQDKKLDAIYREMVRAKKWAIVRTIITIAFIVIPLVGLSFVIPAFLKTLPNLTSFGLQ